MNNLTVIQGNFGAPKPEDLVDHEICKTIIAEWVERVKERGVRGIAICAIAEDGSVMTQYAPASPDNVFSLFGGINHLALRLWQDKIEKA